MSIIMHALIRQLSACIGEDNCYIMESDGINREIKRLVGRIRRLAGRIKRFQADIRRFTAIFERFDTRLRPAVIKVHPKYSFYRRNYCYNMVSDGINREIKRLVGRIRRLAGGTKRLQAEIRRFTAIFERSHLQHCPAPPLNHQISP
jgi:hypothetical protein